MEHNHAGSYHTQQSWHLLNSPHIHGFNVTQRHLCSCRVLAKMFLFDSRKHLPIIGSWSMSIFHINLVSLFIEEFLKALLHSIFPQGCHKQ